MLTSYILGISIVLQFTAAAMALWLIRVTGKQWAWILVAMALTLMGIRRCITFYGAVFGSIPLKADFSAELVAIAISTLMVGGVASIAPIFLALRQSERSLKESEERYKVVLETAPDGILTIDSRGIIQSINSAAIECFGYTQEQLIGQNVRILMDSPDTENHDAYIARYLKTGQKKIIGRSREVIGLRKSGATFPMSLKVGEFQHHGEAYFTGIVRDITEIKRAEEYEEHMGQILESSLNEIYIFDADTLRFTKVNRGARENLGYSMDELKHLTPLDLKPEHTPESFAKLIEPLQSNRVEKVILTTAHRRKNGSLYPVEVHLQLSRVRSPTVFVAIIIDVTDRKRAQQALQEAHDKLEQRVRQRTEALEETYKELEAFTYSVSHDLRAPVRHVGSYARILIEDHADSLGPKALHCAEVITGSAKKMGNLIDDLLTLSRLGRQPVKKELVDCNRLVKEVWKEVLQYAKTDRVRLELKPLPPAYADPALLRHVWFNLLDNAVKYSSTKQDPFVLIKTSQVQSRTMFNVQDNGVGFDLQYADKLFGVFQRLHREDEFPGTGVGLAIVQRIIHKHGGSIHARGEIGAGATFEFTLGESVDGQGNGNTSG